MVKKLIAVFMSVVIISLELFSTVTVSKAAEDNNIIAKLSSMSEVKNAGLVPDTTYTKNSDFSGQWTNNELKKEISIPLINQKIMKEGFVEFWAYSKSNSGKFRLALMADNKSTLQKDYYYSDISVNWVGWKKLSVQLKQNQKDSITDDQMSWEEYDAKSGNTNEKNTGGYVFSTIGTPLSVHDATDIKLWADNENNNSSMCINFESFEFTVSKSIDAMNTESVGSNDIEDLVLADFTNMQFCKSVGLEYSEEHSVDGLGAAKFASPNLTKSPSITVINDWSQYNTLNVEMFSEKNTGSNVTMGIMSNNPETTASDYWRTQLAFNWENSWKTIKFSFDAATGTTDLIANNQPLGFNAISKINLYSAFNNNVVSSDTVVYYKRIYLSYEKSDANEVYRQGYDYIPNADESFINTDISSLLRNTIARKQHPRLITTKERLNENLKLLKSGEVPYLTTTASKIISRANQALNATVTEYGTPDGTRLTTLERNNLTPLAMAFIITGDTRYKDRLYEGLYQMANWPDWNPSHFLDCSEASYYFAICYDLLYDSWTPEQRQVIRNGMMKNAIEPAIKRWRTGDAPSSNTNNWQAVCSGTIGMAALSMIDEPGYEDICSEFVSHTIKTLPLCLWEYAPHGAFTEGLSYWAYASGYLFDYFQSLNNCLGTDFGLSDSEGLDETGYYPLVSLGPMGTFNFSDADKSLDGVRHACMFYIAERYNEPNVASYYVKTGATSGNWESFAQYRNELFESDSDYRTDMQLDYFFESDQDYVYSRGSWYDKTCTWIGYKGRKGYAGHGDLDAGQFVLDMQGVRWFTDLGKADYNAEGSFDSGVGGKRWSYYRKRAEAHNTLVINPSKEEDQVVDADCQIEKFQTSESATYGTINLTQAYPTAEKIIRGIGLVNNRSDVIIQDEIKMKAPSEIYSFFTTEHTITLTDNPKVAYIEAKTGEKIRLDIISGSDAKWETMKAEPLPSSPDPDGNYTSGFTNEEYSKLFIHLENVTDTTISVLVRNVYDGVSVDSIPVSIPLDDWDAYLSSGNIIQNLYVNEIPVEGFNSNNSTYSINGCIGTIRADFDDEKYEAEYNQPQKLGDTGFCKITDKLTQISTYYYITFKDVFIDVNSDVYDAINIINVTASETPQAENTPENTMDSDFETRWAGLNEAWITWELEDVTEIDQVLLSFWKGKTRATKFDLYTSVDNVNWEKVFSGKAAGNTEKLETFALNQKVQAKYVKYYGYGNSENGWNSILEVMIPKALNEFVDVKGHWAEDSINQMRLAGCVKGTSENYFSPDSSVSIAEFISMAVRCMDVTLEEYNNAFSDVSSNNWYADCMQTAYDNNLLVPEMYADGKINADTPITREQMAGVLAKMCEKYGISKYDENACSRFSDKDNIDNAYNKYVAVALTARLLNGKSDTIFDPKGLATRAEAAKVLKMCYIIKSVNSVEDIAAQ